MNAPPRRGPIARVLVGFWDGLNFTRRLVFNLLFLLLLVVLVAVLASSGRIKPLLEGTTLVIAPEGALVEQYSSDPFSRALAKSLGQEVGEVQLRDLLRALDAATDDKRIERVLLRSDRMTFSGYASIRELAAALTRLKAAGKQVIAYGDYFEQAQYLLAAQASEVYMDPEGGLLLEGLGRYRQYYREGLQDKLQVDVHLFKVGEYKSAAEPYVLDAASPEAKEADLYWMNDVWQRYLGDLARARRLAPAQIAAGIDTMPAGIAAAGGDLGRYALEQKLVDGLKTREQVHDLLAERGEVDEEAEGGFRQVSLAGYLKHVDRVLPAVDKRPQVAVVVAEGEITGGEQPPGIIGGESTSALLREARDDDDVKAVVLRVDSPGGEVFASEQIRREIVALKQAGKPVVVSMGDLAASGGYWISMNADSIYADESTITGSIGIFGLIPTFPRTLEKIGVRTDGVGTTRFAGAFNLARPLMPEVGQVIQAVIENGYRDFTGKVAKAREQSVEQIDAVGRGRVWSGAQAKERGLIPTFPRTLEKIGVRTDGVGTTRFAGAFNLARPLMPEVGQVVQAVIENGYRDFTGKVAKAREQSVEQIDAVGRGRVWSGAQAKERGLVDKFGGLQAAIADAAVRAKLGKREAWRVRYVEKPATPFERWLTGFAEGRVGAALLQRAGFAEGLLARMLPDAERELRFLERAMTPGGAPVKALAYCFCGF